MIRTNRYGQPVGEPLTGWEPARSPHAEVLQGRYCRLERLDPDRHAGHLYSAYAAAPDAADWTYMSVGPFDSPEAYRAWAVAAAAVSDPRHYAVVDPVSRCALGTLSLMRPDPGNGSIEVGWVMFSRSLQRTPASTEAQYLLIRHVFDDLGYRRYEWKCDGLNQASRRAALRLGFRYEGTFRDHMIYKGRNRDTAWFSLTRTDWSRARGAFEEWLEPSNFDAEGRQHIPLRII